MYGMYVQIVPEIIAMAFSILWLSWVRAGVRCLSHTTFIYYTERQTGWEPGADRLAWGKDKTNSKQTLPLKIAIHRDADGSMSDASAEFILLLYLIKPFSFYVSSVENNQSWIIIHCNFWRMMVYGMVWTLQPHQHRRIILLIVFSTRVPQVISGSSLSVSVLEACLPCHLITLEAAGNRWKEKQVRQTSR